MNSVMRCHNCFRAYFILLLLFSPINSLGYVVGSNTAMQIEPFYAFPQTATNNMMLGFASTVTAGFALAMSNTCTWNAFFPTGSTIYLNGGTLNLSEDLIVSSNASIYNSGTINANNRAIIFENELSSTIPINNSAGLSLINSQNALNVVYTVDWSSDNLYVAAGTAWQSTGSELRVYSFNGSAFTLAADIHPINPVPGNLYDLAWSSAGGPPYYLAVATANDLRAFQFTPTSGLVQTGIQYNGPAFHAVSWHPSGTIVAGGAFTLPYVAVFSLSTSGALSVISTYTSGGGVVSDALSFDYTGSYLAVGTNVSGQQLQLFSWNGTSLTLITSANTGGTVYGLTWSPDGTLIAIGLANQLQIYGFNRTTQSLTQIPSYTVSGFSSFINSISWSSDGNFIALTVYASDVFQLFAVNRTAQQLSLTASYTLSNAANQIKYSSNDAFIATGDNANNVSAFDFSLANTITFANAAIQISGDTYLNVPFIFQGTSVLDGHNCGLYLGSAGSITVASGASLLLKNVNIYNVARTNINCLDNTGTLSFYNVTWSQDADVTFTQGQLAIIGDLIMAGNHRFIYESDQVSTIYDLGMWYFDNGMTFSYAPLHGENNLISFQDNQSILYLNGTTLYAPSTGLRFTNGCLKIEGQCQFINTATSQANGIWIGDGTPADNVTLKILPESGIITGSGYVSYGNTY